MELRQYISFLRRWLWLIILSVMIAGGSSFFASRAATPIYQTKTTLMVGRVTENPEPNSAEIYTGQQLAYTYMQLVNRQPVIQGAIDSLGLQMDWWTLSTQVGAYIVPQTQLIEITVMDSNPQRAKLLADAIAQQLILQSPTGARNNFEEDAAFIQQQIVDVRAKITAGQVEVRELREQIDTANSASKIQSLQTQVRILDEKISGWQELYSSLLVLYQGGNVNTLTVFEEAFVPTWPVSPNIKMNVLLAAVIGLVLSAGGAILIEYFDDTVKTVEDLEKATQLPAIGSIGRIQGFSYPLMLVAQRFPSAPVVEAFRVLRTNLQYFSVDKQLRTIAISGPGPRGGKSVTAANLAVVMAQSGMKVILIDADLRRPVQHTIFNLDNQNGLSNLIIAMKSRVSECLQETEIDNLRLITSGPLPPNPYELLGSERLREIIEELKKIADVVLFDCPPVLAVADTLALAPRVDGVILVNDTGRTRTREAYAAAQELLRVQAKILGVVLNRVPNHTKGYYYHYYNQTAGRNGYKNGKARLPIFSNSWKQNQASNGETTISKSKPGKQ